NASFKTAAGSTVLASVSTTSGSTTITKPSASPNFTSAMVGSEISGTGITAGTVISAFGSATSVTLSAAATATGTISATITYFASPNGSGAGRDALRNSIAGTFPNSTVGAGQGCVDIGRSSAERRAVSALGPDLPTFQYYAMALDGLTVVST